MSLILFSAVVFISSVAIILIPRMLEPTYLPIVEGFFQPEFMDVAYALKRSMESGSERGAAFAVYHDREIVVDMWAGYADRESMRRWRNETTTLCFGVTKGVLAFIVALMVERGLLSYSDPITKYWPEFGVNDKQGITVGMLLEHQAGLPFLSREISLRDLAINEKEVEGKIYAEHPSWEPGSRTGLHDWTFGLIMDRLLQKIDPKHRSVSDIFTEEVAKPLDIEISMHLRKEDAHKTARISPASWFQAIYQTLTCSAYFHLYRNILWRPDSLISRSRKTVREDSLPIAIFNDPELREIALSSFSGTGTARGLAKLFSILSNKGRFQGNPILKEDLVDGMAHSHTNSSCVVTGLPMHFNNGMQIFQNPFGETTFGQAGYGGQVVIADPTNKLSMAYLTNYLSIYQNGDDPRFIELQKAVYSGLQKYIDRKRRKSGA